MGYGSHTHSFIVILDEHGGDAEKRGEVFYEEFKRELAAFLNDPCWNQEDNSIRIIP